MAPSTTKMTSRWALPLVALLASGVVAIPTSIHRSRNVASFKSLGCYAEPPGRNPRALTGPASTAGDMTTENCASFCLEYKYFGTEYAAECYCGDAISAGAIPADGDCTMPCAGDSSQFCGAGDHFNMYLNTAYVEPSIANINGYTYKGCLTESDSGRALPSKQHSQDDMTPAICGSLCSADGYVYAGLEYGRECWCANTIRGGHWVDDAQCSTRCVGDRKYFCGEARKLTLYGPTKDPTADSVLGWNHIGCGIDSGNVKALTESHLTSDDLTGALCAAHCSDYGFFGLENGIECYCGFEFGGTVTTGDECNVLCSGDGLHSCGDVNRMDLYSTSWVTYTPQTVGDFSYVHCGLDHVDDRALKGAYTHGADMTLEKCAEACSAFEYFGVEYGTECFCGNEYNGVARPIEECRLKCSEGSARFCGGAERLSVYRSSKPAPGPSETATQSTVTQSATSEPTTTQSTESQSTTPEHTTTQSEETRPNETSIRQTTEPVQSETIQTQSTMTQPHTETHPGTQSTHISTQTSGPPTETQSEFHTSTSGTQPNTPPTETSTHPTETHTHSTMTQPQTVNHPDTTTKSEVHVTESTTTSHHTERAIPTWLTQ